MHATFRLIYIMGKTRSEAANAAVSRGQENRVARILNCKNCGLPTRQRALVV